MLMFLLPSCSGNKNAEELPPPAGYEEPSGDDESGEEQKTHTPVTPGSDWTKVSVSDGLTYYSYKKTDPVSAAPQVVNVVDVDLSKTRYSVRFCYNASGTTASEVMKSKGAVAVTNGGYEASSIVIKIDGSMYSNMPGNFVMSTSVPNWKSEAAVYTDGERDVQIEFSGKGKDLKEQRAFYLADKRKYIISSAPMLIDNYDPVGLTFAKANANVNSLNYEDPDRHQGVRHPRTAIAKTEFGHLLLITVDGRWSGVSEGMTAKELTQFLIDNFDPQYALNLDGGGSTTMCVAGQGDPSTHVVNYPCDNGIYDHSGERSVATHIYIIDNN